MLKVQGLRKCVGNRRVLCVGGVKIEENGGGGGGMRLEIEGGGG